MTADLQRHFKGTCAPSDTVLYLALELSHDTWKLAFATGRGCASRRREVAARDIAALLGEIRLAKRKLRLASDAPVVSCYEAGRFQRRQRPRARHQQSRQPANPLDDGRTGLELAALPGGK